MLEGEHEGSGVWIGVGGLGKGGWGKRRGWCNLVGRVEIGEEALAWGKSLPAGISCGLRVVDLP